MRYSCQNHVKTGKGIANMIASFIYNIDCKSEVTNIMRKFRCPRNLNIDFFHYFGSSQK